MMDERTLSGATASEAAAEAGAVEEAAVAVAAVSEAAGTVATVATAGAAVAEAAGATVAGAGTVERTVGVATGFFFFVSVSAGEGVATTCAGETDTGCFLEGGDGIVYYFMITYIIICLYNFIDYKNNIH
jgi:hypothetical protein